MSEFNEIAVQYDAFSREYTVQAPDYNVRSNAAFSRFVENSIVAGIQLLDIGCGVGADLKRFQDIGAVVYGVDPSSEFVEKAQALIGTEKVFLSGGEALPFVDNSMDVVVSKYALQTSENVPVCMLEAARVLKVGGKFVCLTKHPFRQFLEKEDEYSSKPVDYFQQQVVHSQIFNGSISLSEPSHTMSEYLTPEFLSKMYLIDFHEGFDFPAAQQLRGHTYPTFCIFKFEKIG